MQTFFAGRVSGGLGVTEDALWAMEGGAAGRVTRIGEDGTADLQVSVGEGRRPRALIAAGGALWVLTTGDDSPSATQEVLRIAPDSGEVMDRRALGSGSAFYDTSSGTVTCG